MPRVTLDWFAVWEDGGFSAPIRSVRGRSGVYLIRSKQTGELWYIGESHTGRLYPTITRHFQEWSARSECTYGKHQAEMAILLCAPSEAQQHQYDLVAQLEPRDNQVGQDTSPDDDEDIPF